MASLEIGTPFRSFSLAVSLPLALAGGFQGTKGGSSQSQIIELKICKQTPIILYNIDKSKTFGERIWNKVWCYHKHIENLWST